MVQTMDPINAAANALESVLEARQGESILIVTESLVTVS